MTEIADSAQAFSDADAVGCILLVYWIMIGIWLFFIKDKED